MADPTEVGGEVVALSDAEDRAAQTRAAFKAAGMGRARQVLQEVSERMRESETYPDSITYPLSKPIDGPDGPLHSLTLRDPDASIIKGINVDNVDPAQNLILIARMADVPPSTIKQVKLRDLKEIGEIIGFFTGDGPIIGEGS